MTGEAESVLTESHGRSDDMAANHHQLNEEELRELVSNKGTVRGIKNRVRSSLATIERDEKSVSLTVPSD